MLAHSSENLIVCKHSKHIMHADAHNMMWLLFGEERARSIQSSVDAWTASCGLDNNTAAKKRGRGQGHTWAHTAATLDKVQPSELLVCALSTGQVILIQDLYVFRHFSRSADQPHDHSVVCKTVLTLALSAACGAARAVEARAWAAVWGSDTPVPARPQMHSWHLKTGGSDRSMDTMSALSSVIQRLSQA